MKKICTFSLGREEFLVREIWSEKEIQERIAELAEKIAAHYQKIWTPPQKIAIVAILDGAVFFATDLARKLQKHFPSGVLLFETFAISSYNKEEPGEIKILKEPKRPLRGKHVLIVEDIVDTGRTLEALLRKIKATQPLSITVCVLIDKRGRRERKVKIHFRGFLLRKPKFVIGYGLDYEGLGRALPWIGEKINSK
ncbi:hypoxanthine phosphoribosyltransferase [Candidatus Parcubacteria bacterium]|nr:hypoxanthine phosphoribosyltransferase [Candidatus Parcubacteria bacterium]